MRGKLDTDTLLGLVLLLVAIWLVLEILGELLDIVGAVFALIPNLIGLLIILLIVLWWFDYL
jgi:hypothetical protein